MEWLALGMIPWSTKDLADGAKRCGETLWRNVGQVLSSSNFGVRSYLGEDFFDQLQVGHGAEVFVEIPDVLRKGQSISQKLE